MRVLFASTANEGHFGPLLPLVRAFAGLGHEARVAAPQSFARSLAGFGLEHEPFADVPGEIIGPVMGRLPSVAPLEADTIVIQDVFGRLAAQAGLPGVTEIIERWRPDLVVRETGELASLAAAERAGVPHAHMCIGMHGMASHFRALLAEPLSELSTLAGLDADRLATALADEPVFSVVPELLDFPDGGGSDAIRRFHEPLPTATAERSPEWGDLDRPLVYVTFGSVAGSIPPFAGVFRAALDALAGLDAAVVMTVGRAVDPSGLAPLPANARVFNWLPQGDVLAHASAMVAHGGFGTTMGALAAGVPQLAVPLFTSDQVMNGEHLAAVGAGLTTPMGIASLADAAGQVRQLMTDPTFTDGASRVAAAIRELPPPSEAVDELVALCG